MATKRRERLVGNTRLYDERHDRELHNSVIIEVDETEVRHRIGPTGQATDVEPLVSGHQAVLAFERSKIRQHRVHAHASRPIQTLFVDKRQRREQTGRCPECLGTGEITIGAGDGEQLVPCPVCRDK